ncbi:MAG: LysM peptidoglycan-binding domain-containing protein [Ignavibacteria bacterium]|jgi:membrane-bound lytic murein transglycosylase D|nr:LysM peptidoglycan-binding domain-containing protein [Ignavibacteria bacterium]
MKKVVLFLFLISVSFFASSCSLSKVGSDDKPSTTNTKIKVKPTVIVSELLEEARQNYVSALAKQEINSTTEAINYYEAALRILNNLSYYPEIDENEAYTQLEKSITDDYQKFVDGLSELPEGVSFAALEEWMKKSMPEIKVKEEAVQKSNQVVIVADFPLEVNSYVDQYIEIFQGKWRKYMDLWLSRSGKYFPMMAKIFAEEKVPTQLIFLSMVESGVNPVAKSRAKAVGLWQFMSSTGRLYGLNSDIYFDERRNPEKATRAAAKYLRNLYNMFGDWYLALASYNWGEGNIKRIVTRTGKHSFWEIRDYMPRETKDYVPQFIAVSLISSNPAKYGFNNVMFEKPLEYDTYKVTEGIDLNVLAKCANVSLEELQDLNPELTQRSTPPDFPGGYQLRIPKGRMDMFAANFKNIPDDAKVQFTLYYVKKGETVTKVAKKYGISATELAKINNISTRTKLPKGVALKIPVAGFNETDFVVNTDTAPAIDKEKSPDAPYTVQSQKVRDQENTQLAVKTSQPENQVAANTKAPADTQSVADNQLLADNNQSQDEDQSSDDSQSSDNDTEDQSNVVIRPQGKALVQYSVKKSDNLTEIADLFNVRVSDLRNWNNISYTEAIHVGQTLSIYVPEDKKDYYASLDNQTQVEKRSLRNTQIKNNAKWVTHKVKRGETLASISSRYNVTISQIKQWNSLHKNRINGGTRLKILAESNSPYLSPNQKSNYKRSGLTRYKVRRGDTIGEIADRFGVSVRQLQKWNKLTSKKLTAGKSLKILGNETTTALGDNTSKASATLNYYKIKQGDAIGNIADKFHVSVSNLKKWNKLNSNKITAGKTLKIYSDEGEQYASADTRSLKRSKAVLDDNNESSSSSAGEHVVKSGETLGHIAELYGVRASDLRKWNHISGNKIVAGDKLKINSSKKGSKLNQEKKTSTKKELAETKVTSGKKGSAKKELEETKLTSNKKLNKKELAETKKSKGNKAQTHKVKKGETLYTIAQKYDMDVQDLKKMNKIKGNKLSVGQKLKVDD